MHNLDQELLATLRESLLVLDRNLRVQSANRSYYRTFQVEPPEVENRYLYKLGNGHWDIPQLRLALARILEHGQSLEDFEIEQVFPHIGYKAMLLNARLVEREAGAEPLILLAIDDVTEKHEAAATIQRYLKKLEWSNRELEDFAYIASHDLQEPLRAIQAFSDRLQSKHSHALDAKGVDYLMRIQKAAQRMRLLISDLLTYSRVSTQGKPFEPVDLNILVCDCIADLSQRIEETAGHIEVDQFPVLNADPIQMRQLLQNLLDNAMKFHRSDVPPVVKVRCLPVPPAEFTELLLHPSQGLFVTIAIEDNGIGFEEEFAELIFSPFERLHDQNEYSGTGIGLAVCRRIVERHGGILKVKSAVNEGSTFIFMLPQDGGAVERPNCENTQAEN